MGEQPDLGKIKIMVGGQVIGTAKSGMLTYLDTVERAEEPKHDEGFKQSWDITGNALIKENDLPDALCEMMHGPQLVNVKIERQLGKLPRKMKKAMKCDPYGKTKWGRKFISYRRRHVTMLNAAEVVITKQDQETLTATITKAMEKEPVHRVRLSGEDIMKVMEKYKTRKGV